MDKARSEAENVPLSALGHKLRSPEKSQQHGMVRRDAAAPPHSPTSPLVRTSVATANHISFHKSRAATPSRIPGEGGIAARNAASLYPHPPLASKEPWGCGGGGVFSLALCPPHQCLTIDVYLVHYAGEEERQRVGPAQRRWILGGRKPIQQLAGFKCFQPSQRTTERSSGVDGDDSWGEPALPCDRCRTDIRHMGSPAIW